MNEFEVVSVGLTSIKTAIDIAKTLKNIDKSYNDAEVKLKIIDLMDKLADVKEKLLDIKDENLSYRIRIKELEEQIRLKEELIFEYGVYWFSKGNVKVGPYCQRCQDIDNKVVYLQNDQDEDVDGTIKHYWICKECKSEYPKP
jgi:uncharacterized coiled-coil DUF342 family protein